MLAFPKIGIIPREALDPSDPEWSSVSPVEDDYDALVNVTRGKLAPTKSGEAYQKHFSDFREWMESVHKDVSLTNEENLAVYVVYLETVKKYAASTVWSRFVQAVAACFLA